MARRSSIRRVVTEAMRVYRARWRLLLAAAVLVFGPLAAIDVVDEWVQHPLEEESGEVDLGTIGLVLAFGAVNAFLALGGEVFYTGVVTSAVAEARAGERHPIGELVRTLPWGRLIAIDLLLALVVTLGLILLIVPGLILFAWFALAAPVAKLERRGVRASFARSRHLVRGHVRTVLAILVPIQLCEAALETLLQSGVVLGIGNGPIGDWAADLLTSVIAVPFFALATVTLYFELRESSFARSTRAR